MASPGPDWGKFLDPPPEPDPVPETAPAPQSPPTQQAPTQQAPPQRASAEPSPLFTADPPRARPSFAERAARAAAESAGGADAAPAEPRVFSDLSGDSDLLAALDHVVSVGGSDLHVTVDATPSIRLHGSLSPLPGIAPWDGDKTRTALHSIMTGEQREIFEKELELDFAYTLSDDARFRVNIYQQRGFMGAAFRLIPTDIKPLSELGVPDTIARFARLSRGLVLVTGPTGSGKSTTLASVIDLVNQERADHIVTVEDPIEFLHENKRSLINQREVGNDTHSFASALKHVLRQDPDVILIGELRDLETISVALTAAETGHLVFATLHTQSAAQTIDRVIDVFPPHQQGQVRAQLAATLQGVVCQTLVKSADGKGRCVATEVMVATPAIGNLIREGKTYQVPSAMQAGRELGMHTMDQHLADLVNAGKIERQDAMEKAQNRDELTQLIRRDSSISQDSTRMGSN
ncbi:type IV pilus twitching motility protein PilT [Rhodoglobus vestalii]|uniref:type IV pilus twitching motility protein PilT n=1 Tax=Rhodoglobus vestalii TaxID=193384 RepID=UPI001FE44683|nr:type IV pilus twitching motility protein PilT [Rhodoglobus vestalii]